MNKKKLSHSSLNSSITSVLAALLCILIGLVVGFLVLLAINPAHAASNAVSSFCPGGGAHPCRSSGAAAWLASTSRMFALVARAGSAPAARRHSIKSRAANRLRKFFCSIG